MSIRFAVVAPVDCLSGDDDWKVLLTLSGASSQTQAQNNQRSQETNAVTVPFQDLPKPVEAPDEPEPYGLLDEYVDDLLGIPPEERPSWQRPSWQQTGSSMDVPHMVLQDGSRGPVPATEKRSETPTQHAG